MDAATRAGLEVAAVVLATVLRDHDAFRGGPIEGLLDDATALLLQHETGPITLADHGFPSPPPGGLAGAVAFALREIERAVAAAKLPERLRAEIRERVTLAPLVVAYHVNTLARRS